MGISNRVAVGILCVFVVVACAAVRAGSATDEPTFPSWLIADDPGDETIRYFWERADRGELDATGLVDLGTLIFDRGHPDEAIDFYKEALKVDPEMYEAWFRIGLVEHYRGDLINAEQAYSHCLKKRPGHAWCNFYYGLLEEELGHSSKALEHYEQAFKEAPRLADPAFNPEVMSSQLALGAWLRSYDQDRFDRNIPMRYLRPDELNEVRKSFAGQAEPGAAPAAGPEPEPSAVIAAPMVQPTPAAVSPAPAPAPPARRVPTRPPATPTPTGNATESAAGETPYGVPLAPIANTSDEAHLLPGWTQLFRLSEALI
jgi:hypothetical protein